MEDVEEKYVEGVEREGEIFIEGLENKKSLAELEKKYSQKVKEIRRIYEKSIKKELNKERELTQTKTKLNVQKVGGKEFQVQEIDLEDSWREKKEIEITSWSYRFNRKIKNILNKITPNFIIYSYYKTKRIVNDFSKEVREFFSRTWENISEEIAKVISYIKEGFSKIITDIKNIAKIFKIKKNKEKEGEKKENGKKDSRKDTK
jgi:hypothetical protein